MIFIVVMFIAWAVGLCSTLVLTLMVVCGLIERGAQTPHWQASTVSARRP